MKNRSFNPFILYKVLPGVKIRAVVRCPLLTAMLCLLFFSAASAQDLFFSADWTYTENQTGITLTDYRGNDAELWIPQTVDGKTVTQLGNNLFAGQLWLRFVSIPGTVTTIGSNIFSNCTGLERVELSFSQKTISADMFRNCVSLEQIVLPKTVTSIGNNAFQNCTKLTEIYLTSVTSIGESAFEGCTALNKVFVNTRLTNVGPFAFRHTLWLDKQTEEEFIFIGKGILLKWNGKGSSVTVPWGTVTLSATFAGNTRIESVTLPETLRTIGPYAFQGAVNLSSINIPPWLTSIGNYAFDGCKSMTLPELPVTLTSIGASAFRGCEKLLEISLPMKVKSIGALAFADCPRLGTVTLPDSITSINKTAFQNSPYVSVRLKYDSTARQAADTAGIPYLADLRTAGGLVTSRTENGIRVERYTGKAETVFIPESVGGVAVTEIGTAAFQNNCHVREVVLPVSVKTVGDWAFSYMEKLEHIELPAAMRSLGANAFTGSGMLRQIRLPRRISEIGDTPFDTEKQPRICLREDAYARPILEEMGYILAGPDQCDEQLSPGEHRSL